MHTMTQSHLLLKAEGKAQWLILGSWTGEKTSYGGDPLNIHFTNNIFMNVTIEFQDCLCEVIQISENSFTFKARNIQEKLHTATKTECVISPCTYTCMDLDIYQWEYVCVCVCVKHSQQSKKIFLNQMSLARRT